MIIGSLAWGKRVAGVSTGSLNNLILYENDRVEPVQEILEMDYVMFQLCLCSSSCAFVVRMHIRLLIIIIIINIKKTLPCFLFGMVDWPMQQLSCVCVLPDEMPFWVKDPTGDWWVGTGAQLFFLVACTVWGFTISPIIMEAENYLIWKEPILEGPMFHFHDCGRKSKSPKTNGWIPNTDGLEKVDSFKIWPFLVSIVRFMGNESSQQVPTPLTFIKWRVGVHLWRVNSKSPWKMIRLEEYGFIFLGPGQNFSSGNCEDSGL